MKRNRQGAGRLRRTMLCGVALATCSTLLFALTGCDGDDDCDSAHVELDVYFVELRGARLADDAPGSRRRPQVAIEAKIVELEGSSVLEMGISWALLESRGLGPGAANRHERAIAVSALLAGGSRDAQIVVPHDVSAGSFMTIAYPSDGAVPRVLTFPSLPDTDGSGGFSAPEGSFRQVEGDGVSDGSTLETPRDPGAQSVVGSLLDDAELAATLDVLHRSGAASVFQATGIILRNGQSGTICLRAGRATVADVESGIGTEVETLGPAGSKIETGPTLIVRPQISSGRDHVTLEIRPSLSVVVTPNSRIEVGDEEHTSRTPVVVPGSAVAEITVRDMGTIALGGMVTAAGEEPVLGVPLLGNTPVLGPLFRYDGGGSSKRETIVFLTPRIVAGSSAY